MAKSEYQRLPRPGLFGWLSGTFTALSSLWLATDHVLLVRSSGYTETYKRFYFRDIQAVVLQKTKRFLAINLILTFPLVVTLAGGLAVESFGWKMFWFSVAGFFAAIMFINLVKGQTCRCYVRTAVQTEQLPPLKRIRKAQKTIDRLRPLIAAAQGGELSHETISKLMRVPDATPITVASGVIDNPNFPSEMNS